MNVSGDFKMKLTRSVIEGRPKQLGKDGAYLEVPFTATFTNAHLVVTIDLDVANGAPTCTRYQVERVGERGLEMMTTEVARGVSIRGLMAYACSRATIKPVTPGQWATPAVPGLDDLDSIIGSLKRTRQPITDERLEDFADSYRRHFRKGHMQEFASSLNYSERQAYRLKRLAIERGFLSPKDSQ